MNINIIEGPFTHGDPKLNKFGLAEFDDLVGNEIILYDRSKMHAKILGVPRDCAAVQVERVVKFAKDSTDPFSLRRALWLTGTFCHPADCTCGYCPTVGGVRK